MQKTRTFLTAVLTAAALHACVLVGGATAQDGVNDLPWTLQAGGTDLPWTLQGGGVEPPETVEPVIGNLVSSFDPHKGEDLPWT